MTELVGLSPTYWAHIPSFICQVLDWKEKDGIYYDDEAPVSRCSLVGVLVAVDRRFTHTSFVVDDGTGLIDCVRWGDYWEGEIGDLVRVLGKWTEQREVFVAAVQRVNEEVTHWRQSMNHRHLLSQTVLDRHLPKVAKDSIRYGRLCRMHETCSSKLAYYHELLYCPCQASPESLDPELTFRNRLLAHILGMERFAYRELAKELRVKEDLLRATVQALCRDGVLYLWNKEHDVYVVISRTHVLEPYWRIRPRPRPQFMKHVPKARLQNAKQGMTQTAATTLSEEPP